MLFSDWCSLDSAGGASVLERPIISHGPCVPRCRKNRAASLLQQAGDNLYLLAKGSWSQAAWASNLPDSRSVHKPAELQEMRVSTTRKRFFSFRLWVFTACSWTIIACLPFVWVGGHRTTPSWRLLIDAACLPAGRARRGVAWPMAPALGGHFGQSPQEFTVTVFGL